MKLVTLCNRVIIASFYLLFFFIPLVFTGDTSELFELNKIWLMWGLTSIIGATWLAKMVFQRQIKIQRTPLDIPIFLFLLSQIIATIFSLDSYVSWWGYYSRFNGGLLSIITYIFLYYALVSNSERKHIFRFLQVSLFSGLIVGLWGLPAHFGYDPTCFIFRGNLDVSCWTDAFQPKVRIFSTLGQPDWMAAYMDILIPISLAFSIWYSKKKKYFPAFYATSLTILFYVDLLFTRSKSAFIALWVGLIFFLGLYYFMQRKQANIKYLITIIVIILTATFFIGTPLSQLDKLTLTGLQEYITPAKHTNTPVAPPAPKPTSVVSTGDLGGTDSGKIRLFVWRGALDAWLHHPLFGTGVETFAFAYYQFRPAGHNLTSEWDYLYNKAHNEYLNYLTTTGAFGLLTYLAVIACFVYLAYKNFYHSFSPDNHESHQLKQMENSNPILIIAMVASYITILISNFFGFSVTIVNLYLFLIPAFVFFFERILPSQKVFALPKATQQNTNKDASFLQYMAACFFMLTTIYCLVTLFRYRQADIAYALGSNYDKAGYWQVANQYLRSAVEIRNEEPIFKDELSINDAVLASAFAKQKDATTAAKLGQEAIQLSNDVIAAHPNNLVLWKTRVRTFYTLASIDQQYVSVALEAVQKAQILAPTDAKISYNLGLLYGQTGQPEKAIKVLQNTIALKKDYRDAYYALGLVYHQAAVDAKGVVMKPDLQQKAVETMHFILDNFSKTDKDALDTLKIWGER